MTMSHEQTSLTPRQRRREATIEAILAQAMETLLEEGIDGLTIGRLASELDYTKGALYRYFRSKDALIAELQVRSLQRVHRRYTALWSRARHGLTELTDAQRGLAVLVLTATDYVGMSRDLPADFALIRVAVGDPRHLLAEEEVAPVMQTMLALLGDVGGLLTEAAEAGAIEAGDDVRRSITLWSAIHGNVLTQKFARFGPELFGPAVLVTSLIRTLLLGWGADPGDLSTAMSAVATMGDVQ